MARLVGINHVALEVADLDEALAWYGQFFELELRGRIGSQMAFVAWATSSSHSRAAGHSPRMPSATSGSSSTTKQLCGRRWSTRASR
jgi:catechol 2,3-dioxygenase-like lactoylglutathione lyase family enzyme